MDCTTRNGPFVAVLTLGALSSLALCMVMRGTPTTDHILKSSHHISGKDMGDVTLRVAIPRTLEGRQVVDNYAFSPPPTSFVDFRDCMIATWEISAAPESIVISWSCRVCLSPFKCLTSMPDVTQQLQMTNLTDGERLIETDDPAVARLAARLNGLPRQDAINAAMRSVAKALQYSVTEEELGAARALSIGRGDCTEYAAVLAAVLRRIGIPTITCCGYATDGEPHCWNEAMLTDGSWTALDCTPGPYGGPIRVAYASLKRHDVMEPGYRFDCIQWTGPQRPSIRLETGMMQER